MASHVREGQGLCPIQVTSSNWEEEEKKFVAIFSIQRYWN
jgi:hypothetical protein